MLTDHYMLQPLYHAVHAESPLCKPLPSVKHILFECRDPELNSTCSFAFRHETIKNLHNTDLSLTVTLSQRMIQTALRWIDPAQSAVKCQSAPSFPTSRCENPVACDQVSARDLQRTCRKCILLHDQPKGWLVSAVRDEVKYSLCSWISFSAAVSLLRAPRREKKPRRCVLSWCCCLL